MPTWLWIVLGVVVLLVVFFVVGQRSATRGIDPTSVSIPPQLADEVTRVAVSGKTIAAIKLLRDGTGMPLRSATVVVDKLVERHRRGGPGARGTG